MAGPESDLGQLPEERLQLAIKALQASQVANIHVASQLYNAPFATLYDSYHRLRGHATRKDA